MRIFIILLCVFIVALGLFFFAKSSVPEFEKTGGYIIICDIGGSAPPDDTVITEVCKIFKKRVNFDFRYSILVRPAGDRMIEVCVPVRQDVERIFDKPENIITLLNSSGVLEFRILPTKENSNISEPQDYIKSLASDGPEAASNDNYLWCKINDPGDWSSVGIIGQFDEELYVLCSNQEGEIMLKNSSQKWGLKSANTATDQFGRPTISFNFDDVASEMFYQLTKNNLERPLAILLDNKVYSAPYIQSPISSSGMITGSFSYSETVNIADILNAGSLPVPVHIHPDNVTWFKPE